MSETATDPRWSAMTEAMTEAQADRIHEARHALEDILDLLKEQERDLNVVALAYENPWRFAALFENLGLYQAAVKQAGDALFQVLNVGTSHLHDPVARATIDRWYGDLAAEKQAAAEEVPA